MWFLKVEASIPLIPLVKCLSGLLLLICILLSVAFLTLVERKIMGFMQRRRGPNVVGIFGILQPLADGLKLIAKEELMPGRANQAIFVLSPLVAFFLSLINWAFIPFDEDIVLVDINLGILFSFAVSSLSVYGIICSGWSSNSKYPFLGSLRCAAQLISYELALSIILLIVFMCSESSNLTEVVLAQSDIWYIFTLFPAFIIFFISSLAETNRPPFDLPEAEAELVSGYNVEYSALSFALFFLAEYANILLMCTLISIFFFGGWLPFGPWFLAIKVSCVIFIFVWVRAAFPRLRYDQLMDLGWKVLLPLSFTYFFLIFILFTFNF